MLSFIEGKIYLCEEVLWEVLFVLELEGVLVVVEDVLFISFLID